MGLLELDARVPLRRLEIFCVVVEEGGVTRAAERLYLAQPAVSSQIRALERWLHTELFQRKGNQSELTEAGQRLYEYAVDILSRSREMLRDIEGVLDGVSGAVVVMSSLAVATYLIPPTLFEVLRAHPEAEITSRSLEPQRAIQIVATGACDVALLVWDDEPPVGVAVDHVHHEPIILVASAGDAVIPDTVAIDELASLTFVSGPADVAPRRYLDRQLRDHHVKLDVAMALGHAEAIKTAVTTNGWVAFLPLYAAERDLAEGRLRRVEVPGLPLVESCTLMHREGKRFTPLQRATLDALRQALMAREAASSPVPEAALSPAAG